jgi:GntR family transcriptional regulator
MTEPIYRQIADDLRGKIESDEFAHGERLPTEADLMERYETSRNTVRDAIKLLSTRGLVETRAGQGTFVAEKVSPFITTLSDPDTGAASGLYRAELAAPPRSSQGTHPKIEIQQAGTRLARELRLDRDAQVVSRRQERCIDGVPWSLRTSFYPMWLVGEGAIRLIQATDIKPGVMSYLKEALGIEQTGWRDTILVRAADEAEAMFLRLPDDGHVPVVETRRVVFDQHHRPVRLTASVYPADRNQFVINFGSAS